VEGAYSDGVNSWRSTTPTVALDNTNRVTERWPTPALPVDRAEANIQHTHCAVNPLLLPDSCWPDSLHIKFECVDLCLFNELQVLFRAIRPLRNDFSRF
jgi:hypothetical protein